jgi:hypothetical protein
MKIVFENYRKHGTSETLNFEWNDEVVILSCENTTHEGTINHANYFIKKDELKDFIGGLLHIQSKMKR